MNMYKDYCREMYDRDVLIDEHGFIVYKIYEDNSLYIHAIYVEKDKRKEGYGRYLEQKVINKENVSSVYCYVDLTTSNPELSLKSILMGGYTIHASDQEKIVLRKDI